MPIVSLTQVILLSVLVALEEELAEGVDAAGLGLVHGYDGCHNGILKDCGRFFPCLLQL